jgi:AAHS family 4-hydroxybenzoate transporter-like MFS transporter
MSPSIKARSSTYLSQAAIALRTAAESIWSGSAGSGVLVAICLLQIYQGYTLAIPGVAAPWIAASFKLDEQGLARLFAWMSVAAVGSLFLARLADRIGRRQIILLALFLTPLFSAGAALARTPTLFAVAEILISSLLGGSVSSAIVLLAEELPTVARARGQGAAALASAIGNVLVYPLVPLLVNSGHSWRWLLAPCIGGIALAPVIARLLPKRTHFTTGAESGEYAQSSFYDVLHPLYRRRALALLSCAALDTLAGAAVNGWLYFDAVSVIGLSPDQASTLVVAGMVVGMVGFPIGAKLAERLGRVPAVAYFGGPAWLGALAFYYGPPSSVAFPMLWLLAAYCWFRIGSSIMTVGANAAATELFPASLRATMVGWQTMTGALFTIIAQVLIAALIGPLGSLTRVIRYFSLLGIPSAIVFRVFVDETRGLPLEVAAHEAEWAALRQDRQAVSRLLSPKRGIE